MKKNFNRNRILSLALMILSSVLGWYSLILFTNPCDSKEFLILLKINSMVSFYYSTTSLNIKCFTIIPKIK